MFTKKLDFFMCGYLTPADEETAPIVRQIFEWAAEGESVNEIVRRLVAEGIPTPGQRNHAKGFNTSEKLIGNSYWNIRTVKNILSDKVYIGDMVQGKTRKVHGKQINVDPCEWVCVPNTHEPIISRDIFERIVSMREEIREQASNIKTKPYTTNVLKGKIFCGRCGHPMHRNKQSNHDYYWYRCESQWKYGKDTCVQVSVKEDDLKNEILTLLHRYSEAILGRFISFEKNIAGKSEKALEAELREINAQLDKDGRMRQSLYENMVSGIITQDESFRMKADYEKKIAELSHRANEIRSEQRKIRKQVSEYRNLADAVSAVISNDTLTAEIIGLLIDKILVFPDKSFDIIYRFKDEFEEVRRCG